jgi:hypothetical protein
LGNTTLSVGDGAFMGAVENQRQLWLTGESHPEMIFQMMGLAAGMGLIMRGFKPRNQRTSKPNNKPDSIAEKMLDKGE